MSLVSYNSVRDCNPSATPKTVPESEDYQLLPQSTGEELKVCFGKDMGATYTLMLSDVSKMQINSTKSGKMRKEGITKRWKSKSCTPLNRRDERQSHLAGVPSSPKEMPQASIHSLGSLRMKSCKGKKCKTDTYITATFQRLQENGGYRITKEPLAVSGGQVGDSLFDPIDKVRQFNTQCKGKDIALSLENGFPALLTDSSFFSHGDRRSSAVVADDSEPFIKLPVLGKSEAKHRRSKAENGSSGENSKQVSEPRPVFIIPFGAFDDPVDIESDLKRKADKKEKPSANNPGDGIKTSPMKETIKPSEELEVNSTVTDPHRVENDTGNEKHSDEHSVKHPATTSGVHGCANTRIKGTEQFDLSQISDGTKDELHQKITGPTDVLHGEQLSTSGASVGVQPSQRMNGSQVYGGYFPTTGRKESKLFYAEISTCSEQNPVNGDDSLHELSRRTRSSSTKKANSNTQIPKHAFVKASYVSRKSFSRQSVDRSPRVNGTLRHSEKNLLHVPLTGHQFSRFNGIHER
ncbi:hypothetical protein OS493_037516 [Desmophyllum pertusum]|uniref:Uncharacterized protein n=1 Tax=Desmophyllum pertusum TaxID=174260 RepID=A0A9W9ZWV4_9CNID|nr:hypothetical protein OS493_037516 [Desmophyllum pertusum]